MTELQKCHNRKNQLTNLLHNQSVKKVQNCSNCHFAMSISVNRECGIGYFENPLSDKNVIYQDRVMQKLFFLIPKLAPGLKCLAMQSNLDFLGSLTALDGSSVKAQLAQKIAYSR